MFLFYTKNFDLMKLFTYIFNFIRLNVIFLMLNTNALNVTVICPLLHLSDKIVLSINAIVAYPLRQYSNYKN